MASQLYQPCCDILSDNNAFDDNSAMTPTQLANEIVLKRPDILWSGYPGPIRAILIKAAANANSPIQITYKFNKRPRFFLSKTTTPISNEATEQDINTDPETIIENAFQDYQNTLRETLLKRIQDLDSSIFEELANVIVAKLLGGTYHTTQRSHDHGIDGVIYCDDLRLRKVFVQSKRFTKGNVDPKSIQAFESACEGLNGVFVTSSDFSNDAKEIIKQHEIRHPNQQIILINGKELLDYMFKLKIGLKTTTEYAIQEIDDNFFDNL